MIPAPKARSSAFFETVTQIIRKGKESKPNEFAKMVKLREAETVV